MTINLHQTTEQMNSRLPKIFSDFKVFMNNVVDKWELESDQDLIKKIQSTKKKFKEDLLEAEDVKGKKDYIATLYQELEETFELYISVLNECMLEDQHPKHQEDYTRRLKFINEVIMDLEDAFGINTEDLSSDPEVEGKDQPLPQLGLHLSQATNSKDNGLLECLTEIETLAEEIIENVKNGKKNDKCKVRLLELER